MGKEREKERLRRGKVPRKGSYHPQTKRWKESYKIQFQRPKATISNASKGHIALHCPNKWSMCMKEDENKIVLAPSKLCSIIIDSDNSVNVATTRLVEKLKLPTLAHPKPYKLQWLNSEGEIAIAKQVSLVFTMGQYKDEILCDIVSMEAVHILLGRPWQHDYKVTHDKVTNKFTFYQDARELPRTLSRGNSMLITTYQRDREPRTPVLDLRIDEGMDLFLVWTPQITLDPRLSLRSFGRDHNNHTRLWTQLLKLLHLWTQDMKLMRDLSH
ncbi:hypothetical protein CR513_10413, partial [Mucuna pruriens]